MGPQFFATPAAWRSWLERHHAEQSEIVLGYYKKDSGKQSITWPQSVDVALCFGWIDGIRRKLDDISYSVRFTPRKPRSIWSAVNSKRVEELTRQGLMHPAGIKAFEARREERSGIYAFEQKAIQFEKSHEQRFRADALAWKFFSSQPPWYQRTATWWVISAKREETREKRFATLMKDSAEGRTIRQLTRRPTS